MNSSLAWRMAGQRHIHQAWEFNGESRSRQQYFDYCDLIQCRKSENTLLCWFVFANRWQFFHQWNKWREGTTINYATVTCTKWRWILFFDCEFTLDAMRHSQNSDSPSVSGKRRLQSIYAFEFRCWNVLASLAHTLIFILNVPAREDY